MKVIIEVRTPKGQAKGTEKKLKPFIIGFNKVKCSTYTSKEDDTLYWEVEGDSRRISNIHRNLSYFDNVVKLIFENKMMKKLSGMNITEKEMEELKEMLANQTKVRVIKTSELDEVTTENKTFWQRIKEQFKKN